MFHLLHFADTCNLFFKLTHSNLEAGKVLYKLKLFFGNLFCSILVFFSLGKCLSSIDLAYSELYSEFKRKKFVLILYYSDITEH